ncbi:hypothetical protein F1654_06345 [Alkalicaulis satelles]|uniref:DAGKc domain-containing protein n=1 Tax=Alkalicaulis satelles TaxID=2609175 RepID=A0A5M6ZHZ3_9PROT|nr:diacylglycerol kinase family protein [Alkalicaulis satelles]KAA5803424.1 hypothetical protein F1654_06345 [Alkalicaulis satelles]
MKRAAFIANPRKFSGPDGAARLAALKDACALELMGVFEDDDPLAAARKAIEAGANVIVTLGGDGTARAGAQALHDCGAGDDGPFLVPLPLGTANLLPKRIYGQAGAEAILAGLADAKPGRLDAGLMDASVFLIAAAAGFPTTFARAREAIRDPRRPHRLRDAMSRAVAGMVHLFGPRLRFRADGGGAVRLRQASGLMAAVEPRAGALSLVAVNLTSPLDLWGATLETFVESTREIGGHVHAGQARALRIWSRRPIPVMLDGEPQYAGTRLSVTFAPAAIPLLLLEDA